MTDDTTIIAKAAKKIRQFGAGPGGEPETWVVDEDETASLRAA